jgi:phenylalanyl-tRNA synthetase beta chain
MKFSHNWLKELAQFKESPQKLAELLALHSFEVESVEKAGNDWMLDIAVLPNRVADAGGHAGLAREIAALVNSKFQIPNHKQIPNTKIPNHKLLQVKIENKEDCRRYIGVVIDGVKVGESPKWMRERLELCGLQAINNLVDAANYVMLETGQPAHIFDFEKIKDGEITNHSPAKFSSGKLGGQESQITNKSQNNKNSKTIFVRRAKEGEAMTTLDDKKLELSPEILVIADAEKPLAIAGIKGGKDSGVSEKTRAIVIEAANFNPSVVRRGSKALGLKTDASYRFEHDLDPNLAEHAAMRLAELIREIAGGEAEEVADAYPVTIAPQKIVLKPEYAHQLIGEEIAPRLMEGYLERLGFSVEKKNSEWLIAAPTIRRDIASPEDVIEEIARLHGYGNIKARASKTLLHPALANDEHLWEEKTRDFFKGAGFIEAYSYAFAGEKEIRDFGDGIAGYVELENPTSPETQYLVKHSLFKYARFLEQNLRHEKEAHFFAVTKDFAWKGKEVEERKEVIAAFAKKGKEGKEEFFEMKGIADNLFSALGITDYWYNGENAKRQTPNAKFYHPYRFAEVKIGDETIGEIGELHPAIAENIKLKTRGVFLHLNFEKVWRSAESEREFRAIPKFPAITRDIALIVPRNTKIEAIQNVIESSGGALLADVDLFDYFEDFDKKGSKMSVAFHLVFQSSERTLTDQEIDAIFEKIAKAAKEKQWIVR